MGILAWIIVGLVAGFLAKMIMPGSKSEPGGWLGTLLLGVVGAFVGGLVWSMAFGGGNMTGLNLPSIFVAFIGSILVIGLLRLFDRRTVA